MPFSLLLSRSRGKNGPADFAPVVALVSIGATVVVTVGTAKNVAATVLKSGNAEFVELAAAKLNGKELAAGVATAPFIAGPNCGAFTGTVVLARQICKSQTKVVLFWAEFLDEKVVAN